MILKNRAQYPACGRNEVETRTGVRCQEREQEMLCVPMFVCMLATETTKLAKLLAGRAQVRLTSAIYGDYSGLDHYEPIGPQIRRGSF